MYDMTNALCIALFYWPVPYP